MSQRVWLKGGADGAAGDGRRRALAQVVLVGLLTAVAEVLPLGFAIYGVVLLVAWVQHRWDAT